MFDMGSDMNHLSAFTTVRVSFVHYASAFVRGFGSALALSLGVRSGSCASELSMLLLASSFEK